MAPRAGYLYGQQLTAKTSHGKANKESGQNVPLITQQTKGHLVPSPTVQCQNKEICLCCE